MLNWWGYLKNESWVFPERLSVIEYIDRIGQHLLNVTEKLKSTQLYIIAGKMIE